MTASLRDLMTVCPDCICAPILCRADTTGQHCQDAMCAACTDGCPTGEHDMTAVPAYFTDAVGDAR